MMSDPDPDEALRGRALEALPQLFSLLRDVVSNGAWSSEREELRTLIEACVVGAHRLRLAERLRAGNGCGRS